MPFDLPRRSASSPPSRGFPVLHSSCRTSDSSAPWTLLLVHPDPSLPALSKELLRDWPTIICRPSTPLESIHCRRSCRFLIPFSNSTGSGDSWIRRSLRQFHYSVGGVEHKIQYRWGFWLWKPLHFCNASDNHQPLWFCYGSCVFVLWTVFYFVGMWRDSQWTHIRFSLFSSGKIVSWIRCRLFFSFLVKDWKGDTLLVHVYDFCCSGVISGLISISAYKFSLLLVYCILY